MERARAIEFTKRVNGLCDGGVSVRVALKQVVEEMGEPCHLCTYYEYRKRFGLFPGLSSVDRRRRNGKGCFGWNGRPGGRWEEWFEKVTAELEFGSVSLPVTVATAVAVANRDLGVSHDMSSFYKWRLRRRHGYRPTKGFGAEHWDGWVELVQGTRSRLTRRVRCSLFVAVLRANVSLGLHHSADSYLRMKSRQEGAE